MKSIYTRILTIIFAVCCVVLLPGAFGAGKNAVFASAQEAANVSGASAIRSSFSEKISGTGKYFEIKNSRYLNVSLASTEEVKVVFDSFPKIVDLNIGAASSSTISTDLKISGLEPGKTYYKYEDSYKNRTEVVLNDFGEINWTQDLAVLHHVWLQETMATTYIDHNTLLVNDLEGSVEITADNVTLDCQGHQIFGSGSFTYTSGFGVYLNDKSGVTIKNCLVTKFNVGIYIVGSLSKNDTVIKNEVFNNDYGIMLMSPWWSLSYSNTVSENKVYSNYGGVEIYGNSNGNITDNNIHDNLDYGLLLDSGTQNYLRDNVLTDNLHNFGVNNGGAYDIDTSNTVDGKPVYFLYDQHDKIIDASSNAGYIGVFSSNNILIKDASISNNIHGIDFYYSTDCQVINSKFSGNNIAVDIGVSARIKVQNNQFVDNPGTAVVISNSSQNAIVDNDFKNNYVGVMLTGPWEPNGWSHDDQVYHNNFIENIYAVDVGYRNYNDSFDNGYPAGGNYYSDYTGVDVMSGPNQDQPGADGIGDTSYLFNPYAPYVGWDQYPLMKAVDLNQEQKWSFAVITDLHVGQSIEDYGDATWDDGNSGGDDIVSVKNLKKTVDLINYNIGKFNVKFVIVDGDFSNSAELSELNKAKEILQELNIPWIPLLGNHDVWPYYGPNPDFTNREDEMAPRVGGLFDSTDRYFDNVFESKFKELSDKLQGWKKETVPVFDSSTLLNTYYQNFYFDFGSYHFIGIDFNSRDIEAYPAKGAAAEGDLHNFPGGTWDWLQKHLQQYISEHPNSNKDIILFAHHPFRKDYWMGNYGFKFYNIGFSDTELKTISDTLAPYKDRIFALFAGHTHENKITSLGGVVNIIETAANVNNPLARIVQFYPDGNIDYSKMLPEKAVIFTAHSPVDLEVTDPDGLIINKSDNQISGAEYIEEDIDGDGDLDDQIRILDRKAGDYKIKVIPDANASVDATYGLDVAELQNDFGYVPTILAENVPVGQVPSEPYVFREKEKNVTQLTYFGDTNGQYSDSVNLSAALADSNGNPLADKKITFQIGEQTVSVTTTASGVALANLVLIQAPGKYYLVDASFVGDSDNLPTDVSAQFEISKEDASISVLNVDGYTLATSTLTVQVLDGDGNILLGEARKIEFKVGDKVIGEAATDGKGEAKIDWFVDLIPKNLTETYKISASFAGDENYNAASGQADFTLKSAKWLKKDAIIKLEAVSKGDLLVTQAIKNIQNSLADSFWIDASHILFFEKVCQIQNEIDPDKVDPEKLFDSGTGSGLGKNCAWPKSGLKVFGEEYLVVKLLQTRISAKPKLSDVNKNVINQAIGELVKADYLLAKVAILESKSATTQNTKLQKTIQNQISKAEENFAKAEALSNSQPDKAIAKLTISWLRAQLAIKFATIL